MKSEREMHIEREGNNSEQKLSQTYIERERAPTQWGKTNLKHLERVSIFIRITLYTDQETIYVMRNALYIISFMSIILIG